MRITQSNETAIIERKGKETPENIFKQVFLDILRLHQQAVRSLLATQCYSDCKVHNIIYVTLGDRYCVWLPCMAEARQPQTDILFIEDEDNHVRSNWVASTREVKQKDSLYNRVVSTLQYKIRRTKNKLNRTTNVRLLELTPQ